MSNQSQPGHINSVRHGLLTKSCQALFNTFKEQVNLTLSSVCDCGVSPASGVVFPVNSAEETERNLLRFCQPAVLTAARCRLRCLLRQWLCCEGDLPAGPDLPGVPSSGETRAGAGGEKRLLRERESRRKVIEQDRVC